MDAERTRADMEVPLVTVVYARDEWYPVYCLFRDHRMNKNDKLITIPESLYQQHLDATTEFERIQTILENLIEI